MNSEGLHPSQFVQTLLDLPWRDILIERILPCLTIPELLALRQVSNGTRQLVDQFCILTRHFDARQAFEQSKYRLDTAGFRLLTRSARNLRLLRFHDQHGWLTDSLLLPVLRANSQITAIYLDQSHWLTDAAVLELAASCPQLACLSLRDCHWLSNAALWSIGEAWPELRQLDLSCCWQMDDSGLANVLARCSRLQRLCVARCYSLTDESLLSLRLNTDSLTHLDITGCWRVTDSLLVQLSEFCRSLASLSARECTGISLAALGMLQRKGIRTDLAPPAAFRLLSGAAPEQSRPLPPYTPPRLHVQI